ncbi:LysR family transcriptional regulator [Roseobacter sp. N2S]|uniref:LysR family transcriptional regulator n=1 Tax=Roseobacter sp. N2S TaxID=2663844 RepID=UPI00285B672F|nr:LysR family transcriptional regulator [Roseobacter sp. N2S]MDR6265613.1 DNA-binding transcriptional LysR family regulator [Roseobacter sp. N2S]
MVVDLDLLEDFLELARCLNFSRAAEARNMTQPAFSRRIKSLETAMETPLVFRTSRSVALTPAGQTFQPRALALVRLFSEAKTEVREVAEKAGLGLTLASTHALSYSFVPRWLMQISGPEQLGSLSMVSDTHRQCTQLMVRGDASFFVCYEGSADQTSLPERQFKFHVIGHDRLAPLCAPDANGQSLWSLENAQNPVPLIGYGAASGLSTILQAHWGSAGGPQFEQRMSSVLAATNLEMAKQGQGVAYLPLHLAEPELAAGRLVRAGAVSFDVPVQIVIYRPRIRLSPHSEKFWLQVSDFKTV